MSSGARRRLDARAIVRVEGIKTISSFDYRALFGAIPAVFIFAALVALGLNFALALLLGVLVCIIVGCLPDKQQLLWLASESGKASKPISFASANLLDPPNPYRIVRAGAIQPGQYIVSCDDCQELRDKIRREKEHQRTVHKQHEDTMYGQGQAGPKYGGSEPIRAGMSRDLAQAPLGIAPPIVKFLPVVTVLERPDGLVILGMAGGSIEQPVREADRFYRLHGEDPPSRRPSNHPDASVPLANLHAKAAAALTDLMKYLTKTSHEDHLVAALLSKKHSEEAILHAVRSALAVGLIRRDRAPQAKFVSRIPESIEILRRGAASRYGHRRCLISRTRLGEMWANPPAQEDLRANTIIVLGNFEYHTSRDDEMREILGKTLGLLERLESRFSETDNPEAATAAVEIIRSARNQPTPQRASVKRAAGTILSVCSQLLIGAGGNELYSLLTQLARIL